MTDLNKAIELNPDDYEALLRRGCAYAIKGDLDKALTDFDQAITLDSAFAEAYFNRALAHAAKNEIDKATADYRQLIQLDPRTPDAYKDWGRAEDKAARAKAVDLLEDTFLKGKAEALSHSQQGIALHKEGQLDKAIAEYDKALDLYPRYTEVYYNRGLAYRQKENITKARDRLHGGRPARSEVHSRLREPRVRLLPARRSRPGPGRLR